MHRLFTNWFRQTSNYTPVVPELAHLQHEGPLARRGKRKDQDICYSTVYYPSIKVK